MRDLRRPQLYELFATVFGLLEEGVLLTDNDGVVQFYNQTAASLEGLQPQQVLGRHIDDLYVSESAVSQALHQALLGVPCDDLLLTEFDERGHPVRIQMQAYPLRLKERQVGVLRLTRDLALWAPELSEESGQRFQVESNAAMLGALAEEAYEDEDDGTAVLCGKSDFALHLQYQLQQLQESHGPLLIWGPPGSGRSSLARLFHRHWAAGEALRVCDFRFRSATAQEILLLGSESSPGLWQQANQGSLLLEDVHLASPRLQDRLVDLLARKDSPRCYLTLPGDPLEAVSSGNLHPGLLERCVAVIELAALSRRSEDLPQICQYLLHRINQQLKRRIFGLTPLAKEALQQYPWPGGLRELYAVLEGAVLQSSGAVITPDLLPNQLRLVNQGVLAASEIPPAYPRHLEPRRFRAGILSSEPRDEGEAAYFISSEPSEENQLARGRQAAASIPPSTGEEEIDAAGEGDNISGEIPAFIAAQPLTTDISIPSFPEPSSPAMRRRYGELEKKMIVDALTIHDNDLKAAAKELRMRESTLRRRLELYSIEIPLV